MNDGLRIAAVLISVCFLLWVWPNVVHEPLHAFAAKVQGVDASMTFDWTFPPHPRTSAPGIRDVSVVGVLFYVLLPSLFSIVMLLGIWLTRHVYAGILTHVALPAYLGFDLTINLIRYTNGTSDFHFMVLFPWVAILCTCVVVGMTALVVGECMRHVFGQPEVHDVR